MAVIVQNRPDRFRRSAGAAPQGLALSRGGSHDPDPGAAQGFRRVILYGRDRGADDLQELGAPAFYSIGFRLSRQPPLSHLSSISGGPVLGGNGPWRSLVAELARAGMRP